MQKAKESLDLAIESMANQMPVEVVELDIRQAWEKAWGNNRGYCK